MIIYIMIKIYYMNKDPESHIYGAGGGTITTYINNKITNRDILPITNRTHINIMELLMLYNTLKKSIIYTK